MTRNPIPTDEALRAALAGVFRSGVLTFFEITETGEHRKLNVSDRLRQLGMSYGSITAVFKSYPFQKLEYRSPCLIAKEEAKGKANKLKDINDELDNEPTAKHEPKHKQYEIVKTSSGFWGIFSNDTATTKICGRERQDAERELLALLKRQEPFQWYSTEYRQPD